MESVGSHRFVTPHTATERFASSGGGEPCLDEDGESLHGRTVVLHQHTEHIQCMVNLRGHPTAHVSDESTNHLLATGNNTPSGEE